MIKISHKPVKHHATVVFFDLANFSDLCSKAETVRYIPRYLDGVFHKIRESIEGNPEVCGITDSEKKKKWTSMKMPDHIKYLGDGAMMIWKHPDNEMMRSVQYVNRFFNFRKNFPKITMQAMEFMPTDEFPKNIRFGINRGEVIEMTTDNGQSEYCGYTINLAARLQGYCKELGFIVSNRIGMKDELIKKYGYMRVVAKKIKGHQREIVIVDTDDYNALRPEVKSDLFDGL